MTHARAPSLLCDADVGADQYSYRSTRQLSETMCHGGISRRGRKRLRAVCIQVVLAMVDRTDTPLMSFHQRKKREKGPGKAICATVRKLLTSIFVLLKKELH